MEYYVTSFNSGFLPQGLALHMSMNRHIDKFILYILCLDEEVFIILKNLNLSNVRLLKLSDLETDELIRVKKERTLREYCWTLTPFAPKFVFEANPEVKRVTYLDADLWFRKNPKSIFFEFESSLKDVLITDHAYAPEYDQSATSGQYCVQFMIFTRQGGETVRKWWEDRCIEWCYARAENGKFGDQKYLEIWPDLFCNLVHVLQDKELALAPWNVTRYPYSNSVFFHFHGLRILSKTQLSLGGYFIPKLVLKYVYEPYVNDLKSARCLLDSLGFCIQSQAKPVNFAKRIYRRLSKIKIQFSKYIGSSDYTEW